MMQKDRSPACACLRASARRQALADRYEELVREKMRLEWMEEAGSRVSR